MSNTPAPAAPHATFDLAWLRLREPLDGAARALELTWGFGRRLPQRPVLMDLGSGTGSNLRHLALRLGRAEQSWTLIEKDMKLLTKAPGEITLWAERGGHTVKEERRSLVVRSEEMAIRVEMRSYDLAKDLAGLSFNTQDGVTASALLDLVSRSWLDRLAGELAAGGFPPVLFTLTVDGRVAFSTVDEDDSFVMERVDAHMTRDKGFGPALGGVAPQAAIDALTAAGYRVEAARSDWAIGPRHRKAHQLLVDGYAKAAAEQDPGAADRITAWAARRAGLIAAGAGLTVGHSDIFAWR
ncbi:MAG: hypothetical protein RLY86_1084 [Pseudomonadota bacterium]|jgi:hypothetical protein